MVLLHQQKSSKNRSRNLPKSTTDISIIEKTVFFLRRKLILLSNFFQNHLPILQIYAILTLTLPFIFRILFFIFILILFIIDFLIPFLIYYNWFDCLKTIRLFLNTIQTHQQWLIQIHGFQLIRPTSSLFENQLYQLRRKIFEELKTYFIFSRQIAQQYSTKTDQFICYIDLEEFGPLIQSTTFELDEITNKFDQISINSILKLCHLQINECIQLIHLTRPKSYWIFSNYKKFLLKSIENLNKIKQNCSIMIDYIGLEKNSSSKKFISSYFLLRSNCEQLFEMNENNSEQLKRIIQDLKTVIYSLEGIQSKPISKVDQLNIEEILFNENSLSNITSYHRFDDKIEECMDEILVCHTGKPDDDDDGMKNNILDIDDYDKRLLREQTNCLMKELQTAIQGKKQEWNEREQHLLGHLENNQEEDKKQIVDEEPFEKLTPMSDTITMLDELKHTFVLNRKKLNIDEDVFGEDEIENFGDDSDE